MSCEVFTKLSTWRLHGVHWQDDTRMTNWKPSGKKWSWPKRGIIQRLALGGTEEKHEQFQSDIQHPG
jgi:hypothetical protein